MSSKRVLIIHQDPLLGSAFQDSLEKAGFAVQAVRDQDSALRLLEEFKPEVALVDPVLSSGEVGEIVRGMRQHPAGKSLPLLVLPTSHFDSLEDTPGVTTRLLTRSPDPLANVVQTTRSVLGLSAPEGGGHENGSVGRHSEWHDAAISNTQSNLVRLRETFHEIMRRPEDSTLMREMLQKVHTLGEQMALFGENALVHITSALEVLLYGLECVPERVNPLTLRTLGQAVDFLATLFDAGAHTRPIDLTSSHIMIVEDEASAREMITAAMHLVGLHADGLDTPATGLAVLSATPCDLIFLDVNLPEMNGFELCTRIRGFSIHEQTPIVFITGMNSFQNRVQSSLSGGNDFVGKPFNLAELGVKALIWVIRGRLGLN